MSRYIDADELWKEIESVEYYGCDAEVSRICGLIQNAPTADVEPIVYGKWIKCDDSTSNQKCSICGNYKVNQLETNYCGKCGAKMEKESEKEK